MGRKVNSRPFPVNIGFGKAKSFNDIKCQINVLEKKNQELNEKLLKLTTLNLELIRKIKVSFIFFYSIVVLNKKINKNYKTKGGLKMRKFFTLQKQTNKKEQIAACFRFFACQFLFFFNSKMFS